MGARFLRFRGDVAAVVVVGCCRASSGFSFGVSAGAMTYSGQRYVMLWITGGIVDGGTGS